jgi:hypothetical protein
MGRAIFLGRQIMRFYTPRELAGRRECLKSIAILSLLVGLFCACLMVVGGCTLPAKPTTVNTAANPPTAAVPQIREPVAKASGDISEARKAINDALSSVGDWKTPLTEALLHLKAADAALVVAEAKIDTAVEAVEADARADAKREAKLATATKEITTLKQDDPVRGWLQLLGFAALAIGSAMVVASAFGWIKALPFAITVASLGAVLVSLARFLTVIEWMVFGSIIAAVACAVAWGGWHIYRWIREENAVDVTTEVAK